MPPVLIERQMPSFRTLLVLGRVSNLPTVWSNALLGYLLAHVSAHGKLPHWGAYLELLPFLVGCSLIYGFGMFANDWMDADWDQKHGKARPIPTGQVHRHNVGIIGLMLLFLGLATTWQAGFWTGGLVCAIVIYTLIHKKTLLGILPMAACRFFLLLMGGAMAGVPLPYAAATTLFLYLLALTRIARNEHKFSKVKLVGWLLAGICLHDALWALFTLGWLPALAFVALFLLARILQKSVPAT